ncbi:hypothetical protein NW755_014918, partial [Fusarium falciforme]
TLGSMDDWPHLLYLTRLRTELPERIYEAEISRGFSFLFIVILPSPLLALAFNIDLLILFKTAVESPMASTNRSWRPHGNAKDILNALQTEVSNLLEKPFLAAKPADSENQSPSYNLEEQNTLVEIRTFAQRYLRQTQLPRFKAKADAMSKAQEAGQDEEDGAPETNYDKLKKTLESVDALSITIATECLRQGRSAPSVQELREALKEAKSLAKKETEDGSIINKDEEERAGTTSNDFSVVPVVGDAAAHPTVE